VRDVIRKERVTSFALSIDLAKKILRSKCFLLSNNALRWIEAIIKVI